MKRCLSMKLFVILLITSLTSPFLQINHRFVQKSITSVKNSAIKISVNNNVIITEQGNATKLNLGQRVAYPGDFLVHEKVALCKCLLISWL